MLINVIRNFGLSDIQAVLDLLNRNLGVGFYTVPDLEKAIFENNIYSMYVSFDGDILEGFAIGYITTNEHIIKQLSNYSISYSLLSHQIGVVKTIVVEQQYRNRGIGHKLCDSLIKSLTLKGAQTFISLAWKQGDEINAHFMLQRNGFNQHAELKEYWKTDSLEKQYSCVMCGKPPCLCSAFLYVNT